MNLAALVASASLLFFPASEKHITTKYRQPAIYAQATEQDLSSRIMFADDMAKKNPVSAIPLYRRIIIEDEHLREEAIKKCGDIFHKLIFGGRTTDRNILQVGVDFYKEAIEKYPDSRYFVKANLYYGLALVVFFDDDSKREGFKRMKEAYNLSRLRKDHQTRVDAAWYLGRIGFDYVRVGSDMISRKDVLRYLVFIRKVAPNSVYALEAGRMIKMLEQSKPN